MSKFKTLCTQIAEQHSLDVDFYDDKGGATRAFEDDGTLHVCQRGTRAAFSIGADEPADFNALATKILRLLNRPVSSEALMEEIEESCCPHCGCDCGDY
jgi:hypothetical protein